MQADDLRRVNMEDGLSFGHHAAAGSSSHGQLHAESITVKVCFWFTLPLNGGAAHR